MLGQAIHRTFYQCEPILPLAESWQWLLFVLAGVLMLGFVVWMYRRDTRELTQGFTILFAGLRILTVAGILVFILNPQLKSETEITKTSRLAVLVDTSLSMGLKDHDERRADGVDLSTMPRRIDEVTRSLSEQQTIERLRQSHDVTIYRFGDETAPEAIVTLPKVASANVPAGTIDADPRSRFEQQLVVSRRIGWVGIAMAIVGLVSLCLWVPSLFRTSQPSSARMIGMVAFSCLATVLALALCDLAAPRFDLPTSLGWKQPADSLSEVGPGQIAAEPDPAVEPFDADWIGKLAPNGTATRLGAAIQFLVNRERGGPIAGIVVISDGRHNAGLEPSRALAAASNAGIPIFAVGIGSSEAPRNVEVADIQVPPRVYPGDIFRVRGLIQAFGMTGKTIRVELLSVDENETEVELVEAETTVLLAEDGQAVPVEFEVARQEQGKRRYILRTSDVDGDLDPRDNQRAGVVEIVERKTVVLLMAGGPSREFRFLRNQLYRDKNVTLHVWLQTAKEGADQESDVLLQEFPQTRDGIFQYDCIIAFDPDWRRLDTNQADLLERWVAEKAGGLLTVAGPVNTPEWTRRPRGDGAIDKIRRLYPVSFYSQGSASLKLGRFGGDLAYPLDFTREGRAAEYLWVGDTAAESAETWDQFKGVYGYYAVNEAKPGADILAYFSDPATAINERLPIYLASHYYGAGRVFFQASSEMWRVRRLDIEYFEQYYVKLIRWLSQGRLLRNSTQGVLLTDRDSCWMGDQVTVQAILTNAQDEPLMQKDVRATIHRPDGSSADLMLLATQDAVRPGTFTGSFTANLEGEYRINLPIPESRELDVLSAQVQSNIPDLEKERPQRNDTLLSELADKTSGHYYIGMREWDIEPTDEFSPVQLIRGQDQQTFLPGTPDRQFQRKSMMWLLGLITLALCLEWTFRRLHKLA